MQTRKTKKDYEEYLNEVYEGEDVENFIYLTTPTRGLHVSKRKLLQAINEGRIGSLLRKYDPVAFMVGYGDFLRQ